LARKILLADDSVTAQNMGRRILVEAGYEVITVNNGSAALKKIAELTPDLIILDVYMPGYNGLEVCQRIKAAVETASIPVLLTVGKLEPFKAEEARKVFADAFIIKPFEATELINALTKLEEKIVPQPAAKPVPVQAKAAPAPVKDSVKKQEDQEWKDRLRIQSPVPVVEEVPVPAPAAAQAIAEPVAAQFHDIRNDIAAAETDEAIAENLPANATSEELEAITAAVSAFSEREDEAEAEEATQTETPAFQEVRSFASETETPHAIAEGPEYPEAEEDVEPAEEVDEDEEEPESLEAISPWANPQLLEEVAAALDQPHTELVPQPEVATVSPAAGFTDSEVDAALATLGGDDIMARLHAEEQAHVRSLDYVDAQAAAAWSQESAAIGSTKWIAQEMRLEENEAAVILEEEMQKAHAALLQQEEEARVAALQMQALQEAAAAEAKAQARALAEAQAQAEAQAKEIAAREAAAAQAVSTIKVAEPLPLEAVTLEAEGNTFAAAASASAGTAPAHTDAVADAPVKQEDPELAAAWARWRQIRESVASPQFVSQVANVATAEIQSTQQQAPTNGSKPAAAPSADAIASIVDSVLAQLKPKLVEEIAKQLSEKK
jgi:CheY-like chemotaxis protein